MKSLRTIAVAFAMVAMLVATSSAVVAPGDECGDVNGDGNVSTVDSLIILNGSVGVEVPLECSTGADGCGDVNGDGNLSPTDALLVLNHSVGIAVEFNCSGAAAVRNRVRYLNNLVCNDKTFRGVLTLTSEGLTWESRSGVHSAYQDYDKEELGGGWEATLGPCGTRDFTDLVELPAGVLVRVELTLGLIGNLDLKFYDEGPIALNRGRRALRGLERAGAGRIERSIGSFLRPAVPPPRGVLLTRRWPGGLAFAARRHAARRPCSRSAGAAGEAPTHPTG